MIHYRKGKPRGLISNTLCGIEVHYKEATIARKKIDCPDCYARLVRRDAKKLNKATGFDRDTLEKECDDLWALLVKRKNGGRCARCGNPAEHAHHVISRRHKNIKWDPRAGMPLCKRDHLYWVPSGDVDDVVEYLALVKSFIGERTLMILQAAKKINFHPTISELHWIKKDLQWYIKYPM